MPARHVFCIILLKINDDDSMVVHWGDREGQQWWYNGPAQTRSCVQREFTNILVFARVATLLLLFGDGNDSV